MRRWRISTGREGMFGEVGTVRRPVTQGVGGLVFAHGERDGEPSPRILKKYL